MTRIAATLIVEAIEKYVAAMIVNHVSPDGQTFLQCQDLREELIKTIEDKVARAR